MEIDPEHRSLLLRIYAADRTWAEGGHDDRAFLLLHTGGMQRVLDHPGWDETWPTPTSRQIDDLWELGLLRVEGLRAEPQEQDVRTFRTRPSVRETLNSPPADSNPELQAVDHPAPRLDNVLQWLANLGGTTRAVGGVLVDDAVREFGQDSLEAVCQHLLDSRRPASSSFSTRWPM